MNTSYENWVSGTIYRDYYNPKPIRYMNCREFPRISQYQALRQVVYAEDNTAAVLEPQNTFVETKNPLDIAYYTVPFDYANRLDLIALDLYGNPDYKWVLVQLNEIWDGKTVREGQTLKYYRSTGLLFNKGQYLAPIPPLTLNLRSE